MILIINIIVYTISFPLVSLLRMFTSYCPSMLTFVCLFSSVSTLAYLRRLFKVSVHSRLFYLCSSQALSHVFIRIIFTCVHSRLFYMYSLKIIFISAHSKLFSHVFTPDYFHICSLQIIFTCVHSRLLYQCSLR